MINLAKMAFLLLICSAAVCNGAFAADDVGKVVALRGKASILRGGSSLEAKLKGGIQGSDTVNTGAGSRAKLLFIDDSVLTVAENSKVVVQEFIYGKGKEGKSIFNLVDGKMRTVVGKTKFEVRTPTAVASARGTVIYFDVGILNNESVSKIICLEGHVEVRSIMPTATGFVTLSPGTMIIVTAGHSLPAPVTAPPVELDQARGNNSGSGSTSSSGPGSPDTTPPPPDPISGQQLIIVKPPPLPNPQPLVQPKTVNIIITPPTL